MRTLLLVVLTITSSSFGAEKDTTYCWVPQKAIYSASGSFTDLEQLECGRREQFKRESFVARELDQKGQQLHDRSPSWKGTMDSVDRQAHLRKTPIS